LGFYKHPPPPPISHQQTSHQAYQKRSLSHFLRQQNQSATTIDSALSVAAVLHLERTAGTFTYPLNIIYMVQSLIYKKGKNGFRWHREITYFKEQMQKLLFGTAYLICTTQMGTLLTRLRYENVHT
jgi:hypothetical protein